MKRKLMALVAVSGLFVLLGPSRFASGAIEENISIPLTDFAVFVSCANNGAGEWIVLNGRLHILITATEDGNGGFHLKTHFQPQGLTGVGQDTGAKYNGVGVTQDHLNVKAGVQETSINNFRMIGQGPGNNFSVHENFHITVNANGDITAFVDNFQTSCN